MLAQCSLIVPVATLLFTGSILDCLRLSLQHVRKYVDIGLGLQFSFIYILIITIPFAYIEVDGAGITGNCDNFFGSLNDGNIFSYFYI